MAARRTYKSDHQRSCHRHHTDGHEQSLLCPTKSAHGRLGHDALNTPFEVSTGYSGDTFQARFDVELTNIEDALGIHLTIANSLHHLFVASTLSFHYELCSDPPHYGVKPKYRFHHHVNGRCQVVVSPDMAQLMGEDCFKLCWCQVFGDAFREYQNRFENAENTRFQACWGGEYGNRQIEVQRFRRSPYSTDPSEQLNPEGKPEYDAAEPDSEQDHRKFAAVS